MYQYWKINRLYRWLVNLPSWLASDFPQCFKPGHRLHKKRCLEPVPSWINLIWCGRWSCFQQGINLKHLRFLNDDSFGAFPLLYWRVQSSRVQGKPRPVHPSSHFAHLGGYVVARECLMAINKIWNCTTNVRHIIFNKTLAKVLVYGFLLLLRPII